MRTAHNYNSQWLIDSHSGINASIPLRSRQRIRAGQVNQHLHDLWSQIYRLDALARIQQAHQVLNTADALTTETTVHDSKKKILILALFKKLHSYNLL